MSCVKLVGEPIHTGFMGVYCMLSHSYIKSLLLLACSPVFSSAEHPEPEENVMKMLRSCMLIALSAINKSSFVGLQPPSP